MTGSGETALPPNARFETVVFDEEAGRLRVTLRGEQTERVVDPANVAALFGGRIRHATHSIATKGKQINVGATMALTAVGLPMVVGKKSDPEKTLSSEELQYALAVRVDGVADVWYLIGASFNFRKALGTAATYSLELNLRAFVKRLAAFAPTAVQDAFFTAMLAGSPLPPPVDSLFEFLRIASAR
jgi:hypothetical protein